ncbi:MAG: hypothetical protein LBI49_21755, partial [Nocardiopsaceae bacterium]|nr:hypothetical protein [Nocardiopsaceae bacterium]
LYGAVTESANFLLLTAYRTAPWVAVFFRARVLRRARDLEQIMFDRSHTNWAGPVAMAAGMGLSIWLFSNQTEYVGLVPAHVPAVGDITFEAGFFITAVIYLTWHALARRGSGAVRPAR